MIGRLLERLRESPARAEDPARTVALAAAALLVEVAWADHDVSDAEMAAIRRLLVEHHGIDPGDLDTVLAESRNRQEQSVGLHEFTSAINAHWDAAHKYALIQSLWRLAFEDRRIDALEEHTIRKVADLLYVSHPQFIEAKRTARAERGGR